MKLLLWIYINNSFTSNILVRVFFWTVGVVQAWTLRSKATCAIFSSLDNPNTNSSMFVDYHQYPLYTVISYLLIVLHYYYWVIIITFTSSVYSLYHSNRYLSLIFHLPILLSTLDHYTIVFFVLKVSKHFMMFFPDYLS